jgi:hypothetical protein
MTYWLVVTSLPSIMQGHVFALLTLMLGFSRKPHYRDGVLTQEWRPWFAKRYRYSLTIGHCITVHPNHLDLKRIWKHELVHIRQYEDAALLSAVIAGFLVAMPNYGLSWIEGLILWGSSGALWLLPNFLTGWIRFGDAYRGSEHERSAYAQTDNL